MIFSVPYPLELYGAVKLSTIPFFIIVQIGFTDILKHKDIAYLGE